ncbi:hypothetical protein SY85_12685 [Flavisolibacter tropicus]|uniref:Uncharacterized protein n=1 Tax=Flavisolibacter tropicus TaxID=1492898 RepID=A0A172TVY5_9BACT|nr:hypothetical protein SY85_12685 [Flavisolibacter tropicus]
MGAKIFLSIITAFLLMLAGYLILTGKRAEGSYYSDTGWIQSSFNGYLLLIVALGFWVATVYVFRRNKGKS